MGGLDAEGITGYDEVDEQTVFNGGYLPGSSRGAMPEGRKRGKKTLASSKNYRTRSKRTMGGGFSFRGFSLNLKGFEDTAKAMLAVSVGALVLCGIILYVTSPMSAPYNFYGSLAASIVVMSLLFYTAARLMNK
jgi:hypothetical protein